MSDDTAEAAVDTNEPVAEVTEAPQALPSSPLEVLTTLRDDLECVVSEGGAMSMVERRLANSILVLTNLMLDERAAPSVAPVEPSVA